MYNTCIQSSQINASLESSFCVCRLWRLKYYFYLHFYPLEADILKNSCSEVDFVFQKDVREEALSKSAPPPEEIYKAIDIDRNSDNDMIVIVSEIFELYLNILISYLLKPFLKFFIFFFFLLRLLGWYWLLQLVTGLFYLFRVLVKSALYVS